MQRQRVYADHHLSSFDEPLIRELCQEFIAKEHEAAKSKMRAAGLVPRPWDGLPDRFTIELDELSADETTLVARIADEELRAYAARFGAELRRSA